jgi:hypothetical protein
MKAYFIKKKLFATNHKDINPQYFVRFFFSKRMADSLAEQYVKQKYINIKDPRFNAVRELYVLREDIIFFLDKAPSFEESYSNYYDFDHYNYIIDFLNTYSIEEYYIIKPLIEKYNNQTKDRIMLFYFLLIVELIDSFENKIDFLLLEIKLTRVLLMFVSACYAIHILLPLLI